MVNKPLIRPYFWGGVALGGVARIPLNKSTCKLEVPEGSWLNWRGFISPWSKKLKQILLQPWRLTKIYLQGSRKEANLRNNMMWATKKNTLWLMTFHYTVHWWLFIGILWDNYNPLYTMNNQFFPCNVTVSEKFRKITSPKKNTSRLHKWFICFKVIYIYIIIYIYPPIDPTDPAKKIRPLGWPDGS